MSRPSRHLADAEALRTVVVPLNLGGLECLVGIPATIGGALAMNAGTVDGTIGALQLPPSDLIWKKMEKALEVLRLGANLKRQL